MRQHRIASIPADGIGPEVISAGLEVLDAVAARDGGFTLIDRPLRLGLRLVPQARRVHAGRWRWPGCAPRMRSISARSAIPTSPTTSRSGACGCRSARASTSTPMCARRASCPASPRRCATSGPGDLDWVIVRENSEGEYAGHGGRAHRGLPEEVATETAIFTRRGVERIMRFAFDIARSRPRKQLTVVTKSNAQRHGMVFWDEIAGLVSHDYPDVTWDKELVDAMTMRMVRKPQTHRHRGGDQPARRHPVRPGRRAGRFARHRAHRQRRSRTPQPVDVRADPRLARSTSPARASPIRSPASGPAR